MTEDPKVLLLGLCKHFGYVSAKWDGKEIICYAVNPGCDNGLEPFGLSEFVYGSFTEWVWSMLECLFENSEVEPFEVNLHE